MVLVDYIGIFLHFRILLTDDCVCVYAIRQNSVWTMHGRVNRPAQT